MPNKSTPTFNTSSLTSKDVESTFASFLEAGCLENESSPVNMDLLSDGDYDLSDIAPMVHINPFSRSLEVSEEVSKTLSKVMDSKFTGDPQTADLLLNVRVFSVSKGSFVCRRLGDKPLRCSNTKLTVAYCLFSRSSGKVVMAKQICNSKDSRYGSGQGMVKDMAETMGEQIFRETTFVVMPSN
jgi:hypothetical protein